MTPTTLNEMEIEAHIFKKILPCPNCSRTRMVEDVGDYFSIWCDDCDEETCITKSNDFANSILANLSEA